MMQKTTFGPVHIEMLRENILLPLQRISVKAEATGLEEGAEVKELRFMFDVNLEDVIIPKAEGERFIFLRRMLEGAILSQNPHALETIFKYACDDEVDVPIYHILSEAYKFLHLYNCSTLIDDMHANKEIHAAALRPQFWHVDKDIATEYVALKGVIVDPKLDRIRRYQFIHSTALHDSLESAVAAIYAGYEVEDFREFFVYLSKQERYKTIVASYLRLCILSISMLRESSKEELENLETQHLQDKVEEDNKAVRVAKAEEESKIRKFLQFLRGINYNMPSLLEALHRTEEGDEHLRFGVRDILSDSSGRFKEAYLTFVKCLVEQEKNPEHLDAIFKKIIVIFAEQVRVNNEATTRKLMEFFAGLNKIRSLSSIRDIEEVSKDASVFLKQFRAILALEGEEAKRPASVNLDAENLESSRVSPNVEQDRVELMFNSFHIQMLNKLIVMGSEKSIITKDVDLNKVRKISALRFSIDRATFNKVLTDAAIRKDKEKLIEMIGLALLSEDRKEILPTLQEIIFGNSGLEKNEGMKYSLGILTSACVLVHLANCSTLIDNIGIYQPILRYSLVSALRNIHLQNEVQHFHDFFLYLHSRSETKAMVAILLRCCVLGIQQSSNDKKKRNVEEKKMSLCLQEIGKIGYPILDLLEALHYSGSKGEPDSDLKVLNILNDSDAYITFMKILIQHIDVDQKIAVLEKIIRIFIEQVSVQNDKEACLKLLEFIVKIENQHFSPSLFKILSETKKISIPADIYQAIYQDVITRASTKETMVKFIEHIFVSDRKKLGENTLAANGRVSDIQTPTVGDEGLSTQSSISVPATKKKSTASVADLVRASKARVENENPKNESRKKSKEKAKGKEKFEEKPVVIQPAQSTKVFMSEPGPSRIDEEKEKTKAFLEGVTVLWGKDIAVLDPESGSGMYRLRCKNKEEASIVKRILTNVFGTEIETEIIKGKEHIINLIKIPEVSAESKVRLEEALNGKEETKEEKKEEERRKRAEREEEKVEKEEGRSEEVKATGEEQEFLSTLLQYDAALRGAGVQVDYGRSNGSRIVFHAEKDNKNISVLKDILERAGYKIEWENRRKASKEQALKICELGMKESLVEELRKVGEKSTSKTEFRGRGKEPEEKQREKGKQKEVGEEKYLEKEKDRGVNKLLRVIEGLRESERISYVGVLGQCVVEYLEGLSSDPEVRKRRNALVHQGYISQENIGEWIKYAEAAVENPKIFVPVALLQLQRNRSRVEKDVASIIEERFTFEGTNQMEDRLWKLSRLLELVKDTGLKGAQYSELKMIRNMAMHPEGVDKAELRGRVNAFILCCKGQDRDMGA